MIKNFVSTLHHC